MELGTIANIALIKPDTGNKAPKPAKDGFNFPAAVDQNESAPKEAVKSNDSDTHALGEKERIKEKQSVENDYDSPSHSEANHTAPEILDSSEPIAQNIQVIPSALINPTTLVGLIETNQINNDPIAILTDDDVLNTAPALPIVTAPIQNPSSTQNIAPNQPGNDTPVIVPNIAVAADLLGEPQAPNSLSQLQPSNVKFADDGMASDVDTLAQLVLSQLPKQELKSATAKPDADIKNSDAKEKASLSPAALPSLSKNSDPSDAAGVLIPNNGDEKSGEDIVVKQPVVAAPEKPKAAAVINADVLANQNPAVTVPHHVTQNTIPLHNKIIAYNPIITSHIATEQVAFQIIKSAQEGVDRIKIVLHPEDMGRVDVRLDMHKDGSIKAVIAADKPETAVWLERDAKNLERALQDAGLKTDSNSLEFQSRGQNGFQNFQHMSDQSNHASHFDKTANIKYATVEIAAEQNLNSHYTARGGVNIMV